MQELTYAMQFTGRAEPTDDPNILMATTSSPSTSITSAVDGDGLQTALREVHGSPATFESVVTMSGESFDEKGSISFGSGNVLRFVTATPGFMAPSASPTLTHGAIVWRVEGGEGQFAGATGLITSNFTVGPNGEVIDNQFGVIFLP